MAENRARTLTVEYALRAVGTTILNFLRDVGGTSIMLGGVFARLKELPRTGRQTLLQMEQIGVGSIPLVIVTSVFVGAVAAVQAAYQFQDYVPMVFLGTVVGKSVILELGPVLTALVVGGRVSASIAAELGTMKVTEQIDAMEILAIDPMRYLVMPRVVASFVMLPVLDHHRGSARHPGRHVRSQRVHRCRHGHLHPGAASLLLRGRRDQRHPQGGGVRRDHRADGLLQRLPDLSAAPKASAVPRCRPS